MKILFYSLNHAPEPTGIGKYQGEMAAWFVEKGHSVSAVTAPPYYPEWRIAEGYSGWLYKKEVIDGADIYRVPLYVPRKPTGLKRLVHFASFSLFSLPVMFWLALREKPDTILMTEPPLMAAPIAFFSGWISGAKTCLHVQDFEVDAAFELGMLKSPWLRKLALKMEKAALQRFAHVSTISPNMRQKVIEKGVAEDKALLIQNWANVEQFDPAKGAGKWADEFKKDPDTVLAVYSGNLGKKQGLGTLIEAARLLQNEKHIHFVICGDGAGRADMVENARNLSNVTFLPLQPMDDFVHLMIAADIHLLPQKAGAADLVMPSKLGNILASGRPVVAGANKGTQLYEAMRGCGIAVPPEEGKAFAEAIRILAGDQDLRISMGKDGRGRAFAEWSKDSVLQIMERVMRH